MQGRTKELSEQGSTTPRGPRVFCTSHRRGINAPPVNFQAGMQQPGILQPAEPDSLSIGHRRFTEASYTQPGSSQQGRELARALRTAVATSIRRLYPIAKPGRGGLRAVCLRTERRATASVRYELPLGAKGS
jgi:hypothetical protein